MLSPNGRMSPFQRAQMFSLSDANVFNIAVDGVFDQCQDIVKTIAGELEFKERFNIGSVNSINWGRVVAQVVYYFKAYLAATESSTQLVSFAVPSGNFGNILSGWVAKQMGLPIARLCLRPMRTTCSTSLPHRSLSGAQQLRNARDQQPLMDIRRRRTSTLRVRSSSGIDCCANCGGSSPRAASFISEVLLCGRSLARAAWFRPQHTYRSPAHDSNDHDATASLWIPILPTASRSRWSTSIATFR